VFGPKFDGIETRLQAAAIACVPDVLGTLLRIILEEVQFGRYISDVLAKCGICISSVLVVDDPNVRDDAPLAALEMRDKFGIVPRSAEPWRVSGRTTLKIVIEDPTLLFQMLRVVRLTRPRKSA